MNSSYLNIAAGSFLGTVFIVMTLSIVSEGLFHSEAPEREGFVIEASEDASGGGATEPAANEITDIRPMIAEADVSAGENVFKKCAACHTVEQGGANKVGPNLWGVVNRPIASHEGFSYSAALVEFSEGGSKVWDYDALNHFLHNPKKYVSGTAMGFAGLKKDDDRADIVAYLRTMADTEAPLPEAAAAEEAPAADEASAEAPADDAASAEAPADDATSAEAPAEGDDAAAPADDAAGSDANSEAPADGGDTTAN